MSIFSERELAYLRGERLLGRLATVGADGMPHVVPVGWSFDETGTLIEIGGRNLARSRKFRDVARNGRAALVIDDVLPPWRPRPSTPDSWPRSVSIAEDRRSLPATGTTFPRRLPRLPPVSEFERNPARAAFGRGRAAAR
ncbi:PPOX class F420-dependent oxidoreductase [Nonomuraea sp. NPDC049784]|uniref:PPOX class F420-dependent oxidoreductase n=1 Tax=Nonomuraea sp. NPDC049784 TaxID=3154361 RepID=UPI0033FDEAB9